MSTNESNTGPSVHVGHKHGHIHWTPADAPLWTVVIIDTLVTLFCSCIITCSVLLILHRRSQRREERDKMADIVKTCYWEHEGEMSLVLKLLNKMKQTLIFRDVTELHVFAYKFRYEAGVYGSRDFTECYRPISNINTFAPTSQNVSAVLKQIERFFESLTMQLPCKGNCPTNIAIAFGSTIYTLASSTAMVWSESQVRMIRGLVRYFAGKRATERFDSCIVSDEDLETLVLARVPYANQLYLNGDHLVLEEVTVSNDLKADLKNKIRYIDTVLAKNHKSLEQKEKSLTEAYYAAREICLKNSFTQNKTNLPDIVTKVGEPSKVGECVIYLRHLLRVMVLTKNLRKLENDDRFFQFLMQLYESLYTWTDTNTMLEIIDRVRANIFR